MQARDFDTLTRHTRAAMSRRTTLRLFSATTLLMGLTRALPAEAKRKHRRKNDHKHKPSHKPAKNPLPVNPCLTQIEQCHDFVTLQCAEIPEPELCRIALTPCCEHLAVCDLNGFFQCVRDVSQSS